MVKRSIEQNLSTHGYTFHWSCVFCPVVHVPSKRDGARTEYRVEVQLTLCRPALCKDQHQTERVESIRTSLSRGMLPQDGSSERANQLSMLCAPQTVCTLALYFLRPVTRTFHHFAHQVIGLVRGPWFLRPQGEMHTCPHIINFWDLQSCVLSNFGCGDLGSSRAFERQACGGVLEWSRGDGVLVGFSFFSTLLLLDHFWGASAECFASISMDSTCGGSCGHLRRIERQLLVTT